MKIMILYRPRSEFARGVENFVHDFKTRHVALADEVELLDYDSRDGQARARLYDIVQHPAMVVVRQDGSVIKDWRDGSIPMIDEVANYAYESR